MNNILWLASYPKSGNTWFRVFLTNLLNDDEKPADINRLINTPVAGARRLFDDMVGFEAADLSAEEIDRLRPEVYQFLSDEAADRIFMKIHDAYTFVDKDSRIPLVPPGATQGVIYFIRNPLDVVISFSRHSGISIDQSINRMADEGFCIAGRPGHLHPQLRQRLLSWSGHVDSWTSAPSVEVHVVKFEDMERQPFETFYHAASFAGLEKSPRQIKKALTFSDFDELQRQETERGFREKNPKCTTFFHRGKSGYWQETLNKSQVKKIIGSHGDLMKRFGYLDHHGLPVL